MLTTLAGERQSNWQKAAMPAQRAIASRIRLWDSIHASFSKTQEKRRLSLSVTTNNGI
jgi:hypothetical protein